MNKKEVRIQKLHEKAFNNIEKIKKVKKCYCFHCQKEIDASEVKENHFSDVFQKEISALCPQCKKETLIPLFPNTKLSEEDKKGLYDLFDDIEAFDLPLCVGGKALVVDKDEYYRIEDYIYLAFEYEHRFCEILEQDHISDDEVAFLDLFTTKIAPAFKLRFDNYYYKLGKIFFEGTKVRRNFSLSKYYFLESISYFNYEAYFYFGLMSYFGYGEEINYAKAYEYFTKCIIFEHTNYFEVYASQLALSDMYWNGNFVKQDIKYAADIVLSNFDLQKKAWVAGKTENTIPEAIYRLVKYFGDDMDEKEKISYLILGDYILNKTSNFLWFSGEDNRKELEREYSRIVDKFVIYENPGKHFYFALEKDFFFNFILSMCSFKFIYMKNDGENVVGFGHVDGFLPLYEDGSIVCNANVYVTFKNCALVKDNSRKTLEETYFFDGLNDYTYGLYYKNFSGIKINVLKSFDVTEAFKGINDFDSKENK